MKSALERYFLFGKTSNGHDDRICSNDPFDWDKIEELFSVLGAASLPDFYLHLRDVWHGRKDKKFFYDGVIINAKTDDTPASIYHRYKSVAGKLTPDRKQWNAVKDYCRYGILSRVFARSLKIKHQSMSYYGDFIRDAATEITPMFLLLVQNKLAQKKHATISGAELREIYKKSIGNSKEIEKHISFEQLTSSFEFAKQVISWQYFYEIAHLIKNTYLTEITKELYIDKIAAQKIRNSRKWHADYRQYKTQINPNDSYTLSLTSFFSNIDAFQTEKFVVNKSDLFNPFSQFHIAKLIRAAKNKDFATQVWTNFEHITISDANNSYRVVFANYDHENRKYRAPDNKPILPSDSIYSMSDCGFAHLADWHKKLKVKTR